jgi:hypothetical protein
MADHADGAVVQGRGAEVGEVDADRGDVAGDDARSSRFPAASAWSPGPARVRAVSGSSHSGLLRRGMSRAPQTKDRAEHCASARPGVL